MTIYQCLSQLKIPVRYSHFEEPVAPPFLVYLGDGQSNFEADNDYYYSRNAYQVEFYFKDKDETMEAEIERTLLDDGWKYQKSSDTFIDSEGVFVIYYSVVR